MASNIHMATAIPALEALQAPTADPLTLNPLSTPGTARPAAAVSGHKSSVASPPMLLGRTSQRSLNWLVFLFMLLFHVGAIAALFCFSWSALTVAAVFYVIAINVGIGMGYHRLLTHRGYKVPKWIEYTMAVCATLSLEGGPLVWVATHRLHHQNTDVLGDPHSPHDGGWWSHAGWIIYGAGAAGQPAILAKYAPDLAKDRFYVWLTRFHWVPLVVLALILLAIGGWPWVLWGIFLRVTVGLHATWLVNSATHMWGSKRFPTKDDSRNNWWVALLTGGEGWHNNHHAHPVSARHGFTWYEFDVNYYGIWILEKIGLAKKVQVAHLDSADPKTASQRSDEISTPHRAPVLASSEPLRPPHPATATTS